jgi:hypothetical protein
VIVEFSFCEGGEDILLEQGSLPHRFRILHFPAAEQAASLIGLRGLF